MCRKFMRVNIDQIMMNVGIHFILFNKLRNFFSGCNFASQMEQNHLNEDMKIRKLG